MPYINILEDCVHSIGGIKEFKIATRDINGDPINFPLDIIMQSGGTNTLLIEEDFENRILTVNGTEIQFRSVYPNQVTYLEEEVEGRQGKLFQKTLEFTMPKVNLITNNQLKEFLFLTEGQSAVSNALVYFTDVNNQNWFGSWSTPFILENFDLTSGARGESSEYKIKYVCKDYHRTLKYTLI